MAREFCDFIPEEKRGEYKAQIAAFSRPGGDKFRDFIPESEMNRKAAPSKGGVLLKTPAAEDNSPAIDELARSLPDELTAALQEHDKMLGLDRPADGGGFACAWCGKNRFETATNLSKHVMCCSKRMAEEAKEKEQAEAPQFDADAGGQAPAGFMLKEDYAKIQEE